MEERYFSRVSLNLKNPKTILKSVSLTIAAAKSKRHCDTRNMQIRVCDAICGSGKTLASIDMISNNPDKRYIIITPYLREVARVKACCSQQGFVSPEYRYTTGFSKLQDINSLLKSGENIVSTHSLFTSYTQETKDLIQKQNYTLILDEVIDLFQTVKLHNGDIEMLLRNKVAEKKGDEVVWADNEYKGIVFDEIMHMSQSKNLIDFDGVIFFWSVPQDVFLCFSEVYILTYLFEYQMLKYFFEARNLEYELIGVRKEKDAYRFCPMNEMNRALDLRKKIHILKSDKKNYIGTDDFSLSAAWFERNLKQPGQAGLTVLKNHLYNIFRHEFVCKNNEKMWTTLDRYKKHLKGKGYSKSFSAFNLRATNELADKKYLAFCLNVFMHPWMRNYLLKLGAREVNQDMYALSVLVQWIFRSAIRNDEEVWIYLPSKRMRFLLERWLANLAAGSDLLPIQFETQKKKKELQPREIIRRVAQAIREKKITKGGQGR